MIGWCSGCTCHGHLLAGKGPEARAHILQRDFGKMTEIESCVMAGLRAPELAAGILQDYKEQKQKQQQQEQQQQPPGLCEKVCTLGNGFLVF